MSPRQKPVELERHSFAQGRLATTLTRGPLRMRGAHVRTFPTSDGTGRDAVIPTRQGLVHVLAWPHRVEYTLVLGGLTYLRTDHYPATTRRELSARAGAFARRAAQFHRSQRIFAVLDRQQNARGPQ